MVGSREELFLATFYDQSFQQTLKLAYVIQYYINYQVFIAAKATEISGA